MRTKQGVKELITGILIREGLKLTDLEENAVDRIIEALTEENNLVIPDVSQRSELLPAFLERRGDDIITLKTAGTDVSLDWQEYLKAGNGG